MVQSNLDKRPLPTDEKLFSSVLLLNAKVVGLALGLIFGLGIFVATNWLVIKGGDRVGPHLILLSQYFIRLPGNVRGEPYRGGLRVYPRDDMRCPDGVDL
jgi:hypothetical protein